MKKTLFKFTAIAGLLSLSSLASAEWTVGGGYANYSSNDYFPGINDTDINVGAIYVGVGYTYEVGNMTFMPELRLFHGASNDNMSFSGEEYDISIGGFFTASIRGQYNVTESFGVFLQPSWGGTGATSSAPGFKVISDTPFGIGGGASFKLNEVASIEALYEGFDGAGLLSVGLRVMF